MTEHLAFVSLGSNIEPERNLRRAVELLGVQSSVRIVAVSSVFETAPVGRPEQNRYLNAALQLATTHDSKSLKHEVLAPIERRLGRTRSTDRFASRTIDLDLVLFDELVCADEDSCLPHPDLLEFAHVAIPVAELAPTLSHPVTGVTLAAIARRLGEATEWTRRPDVALRPPS